MNDRFLSSRAIDNTKRKVCIDAKAFSCATERDFGSFKTALYEGHVLTLPPPRAQKTKAANEGGKEGVGSNC